MRLSRRGLSLLELVVVVAIVAVLCALAMVGVQSARRAAYRTECANQLRQMGLAFHSHHDQLKHLPSGIVHPRALPNMPSMFGPDTDPYPMSTWQMRILPFLDQGPLWADIEAAYKIDPYFIGNPPHRAKNLPMSIFLCPADGERPPWLNSADGTPAVSSYMAVSGTDFRAQNGVFFLDSAMPFAKITDGLSNTVAVGERPPTEDRAYGRWYGGWGWWGDINSYMGVREVSERGAYSVQCPEGPYDFSPGRLADPCSVYHYWSLHTGGGNFLFADGAVRFLSYSANALLPSLATRSGNEAASFGD
jgi:prepilin-type N-terminal cleavage/methylation domain-containing protein/prepilin-type processing-associated H-X9-DG protein